MPSEKAEMTKAGEKNHSQRLGLMQAEPVGSVVSHVAM
jgi:hypothetical protein